MLARSVIRPRELILYANNSPSGVIVAQTLVFDLKQIGIDLQVKYFDINTLSDKARTRGEPYDLIHQAWAADYADGAGFMVPLLIRGSSAAGVNLDDPAVNRRIDAASRLPSAARRRAAWADLDIDLMRDNPPWAPYVHTQTRTFVGEGIGCVVVHPVYGFDLAAVCKK